MKKLTALLLFLFVSQNIAGAYIDSQFTSTEQALVNSGFSNTTAKMVEYKKTEPYAPIEEKDDRTFIKKLYNYIDPASGSKYRNGMHNVNLDSSWRDY